MHPGKEELVGITNPANISDATDCLKAYSRDESFAAGFEPDLIVEPGSADEVQKLVRWANQTGTPLVPVSSGPPHFRGDTLPGTAGAIVVDLSGMNRIIRINRRNRMAMIEPGVTFAQLQPELAREGLRVSTPLLPRPNKSVVASLCEREPTMVPRYQWQMLEPLRCLEVVWGNGERLMTGDAGSHGSLEEEWEMGYAQLAPTGPNQVDYYRLVSASQGSLGIVTWASIKCEILPQIHELYFLASEDLAKPVECAYRILKFRFADEFLLLNGANFANIYGNNVESINHLKGLLPNWVVIIGISGREMFPRERVDCRKRDIADIARQSGLKLLSTLPGITSDEALEILLSPSRDPYWKLRYQGGCQDIFFITTLDRVQGFVEIMRAVASELHYPEEDIGVYVQPVHQGVSCHCEFDLPFKKGDLVEEDRMSELSQKAAEALIQKGAFFSRPYGLWADLAYRQDRQSALLLNVVKDIFDPNHIMNPGKLCFQSPVVNKGLNRGQNGAAGL